MSIRRHISRIAIPATLAAFAFLAAGALGQLQFDEFSKHLLPPDTGGTRAVALNDVDGDGDLDLVCGDNQTRLHLNDGTGTFTDATATHMPTDIADTVAVALGDVDSDGDSDLVLGVDGQNRLYLNDGTGRFTDATAARMPTDADVTKAVALADVDGDRDPDLVCGNGNLGQQNRLYLNDGTGTFIDATATRLPTDTDATRAVALGDVDGDGDPDLVFGNYAQQNRLYLNDGGGTFTDTTGARMPIGLDTTVAVARADVDGDGDSDLVWGSWPGQNRLYLNDGTGTFADATAARLPSDSDFTVAVALADVDGDGDPDMVCGNWGQNRLYLNDGTGTFADATAPRMPPDTAPASAVALADVDGDGDPDMVVGNSDHSRLYLNLLRQLDVPFPVELGQSYQLDVYARYGPTGTVNTAVPFISTGTASIPVPPLGTFALDPAQMIRLPTLIVPQPDGLGSLSFVMPNVPGIVGAPVYAQALLIEYPTLERLTNWTADVITQ